jgi:hypothetical protein
MAIDRCIAALALSTAIACSSEQAGTPPAGDGDDCSAVSRGEAGGEAALGTGYDRYEPLGDELDIIAGPQGGFHLNLHARVRGIDFGNTEDLLDPRNPSTFFAIHRAGGEGRLDTALCPVRLGYRPEPGDDFATLQRGVNVVFDLQRDEIDTLFDRPARLAVEVVDADGRHTGDERTVTLRAPDGFEADAGPLPR